MHRWAVGVVRGLSRMKAESPAMLPVVAKGARTVVVTSGRPGDFPASVTNGNANFNSERQLQPAGGPPRPARHFSLWRR
ncbi:hypothetical protein Fuma_01967 [Fuerstiella marisgermanici]|uniref:Uncharacterized protein n=1 Tax=Fuerstiella marisgermanici TaxID=1891926 RepID=A0A1P8WE56_9PLAN|nr:hypothetical protein Fuma_01967 [Fuerstiella marisgermanici]